jgi:hypothetical protein
LLVVLLMMAILTRVRWNLSVVLICIPFIARDGQHFFICFLAIWISSFEKVLFSSLAHFFIRAYILSHAPPALFFCDFFCHDRVSRTICQGWLRTSIFLIFASQVARITGMSHQCPAFFLNRLFLEQFEIHTKISRKYSVPYTHAHTHHLPHGQHPITEW